MGESRSLPAGRATALHWIGELPQRSLEVGLLAPVAGRGVAGGEGGCWLGLAGSAPVWALLAGLPPKGMNATNEWSALVLAVSIGHTVIVDTALAGFGAGRGHIGKAQLRSQNVAFTLQSLPPGMVSLPKEIMNLAKRILSSVHNSIGMRRLPLAYPYFWPHTCVFGIERYKI